MVSKVPPQRLTVNDHLEESRPITRDTFKRLKEELDDERVQKYGIGEAVDKTSVDLDDEQLEFLEEVIELGRSIRGMGQLQPIRVRYNTGNPEVIYGYKRYLACWYIGEEVEYDSGNADEHEIIDFILTENEERSEPAPYDLAVLVAKKLGRWDSKNEELLPPEEASDGTPIPVFSQNTGINRGRIYQMLSPLRQSSKVREEFSDALNKSSLELVEKMADDEDMQYTLAQTMVESDQESYTSFEKVYRKAKEECSRRSEIPKKFCSMLLELEEDVSIKGDVDEEKVKPSAQKLVEDHKKEISEKEQEEKEKVNQRMKERREQMGGEKVPEPESPSEGPSTDWTSESGPTESEAASATAITSEDPAGSPFEDQEFSGEETGKVINELDDGTVIKRGEFGNEVIPPKDDLGQGYIELRIEDQELVDCIVADAEERVDDPKQVARDVLRLHYQKKGDLEPEEEVAAPTDD